MPERFYSFDVVRLRISKEPHHYYTGYKYASSPLFTTLEQCKNAAAEVIKDFHGKECAMEALSGITEHTIDTKGEVYLTYTDDKGKMIDVVITIRAFNIGKSNAKDFYTYHLAFLGVPIVPSGKRCYDIVDFRHGPLFDEFSDIKSDILKMCDDKENQFSDLYEQVWGMSRDVTNIGKWRKTYKEDHISQIQGFQELRLDVFRVQIKS